MMSHHSIREKEEQGEREKSENSSKRVVGEKSIGSLVLKNIEKS